MCVKIGRKPEEGECLVLPPVLPGHERDGSDCSPFYGDDGELYKRCDICDEIKLYNEFPDNQNSNMIGVEIYNENGFTGDVNKKRKTCNTCRKKDGNKYSSSANVVFKKHNIPNPTEETVCEICGNDYEENGNKKMVRDHCHKTNTPRGYICNDCNTGLGMLGDNLEGIEKAKKYLESVDGDKWKEKFDKTENKLI
jgi:hypothetical protein